MNSICSKIRLIKNCFFSSSYLRRTSNLSKKINFTNIFFFRYCCCSDILSLNGSTGPPKKFQSLNDTALTSIYGQTYGKNRFTIFWHNFVRDQSKKKKFGTPPGAGTDSTPILSSDAAVLIQMPGSSVPYALSLWDWRGDLFWWLKRNP